MIPKQIKDNLFVIGDKIGNGNFGDVYKAKFRGQDVAIKFEKKTEPIKCLQREIEIYRKMKGVLGFPNSIGSGSTTHYNFLAVDLLGPSLMSIFKDRKRFFSLPTVLKIGVQILDRLESLHAKNIVHSDLKAENIVIGYNDPSTLYLIDFGLSTEIQNADTRQEPHQINAARGTLNYMSVGAHKGIISFKNDIDSLGYLLVFLNRAQLPWNTGMVDKQFKNSDKKDIKKIYSKTLEIKESIDDYSQSWPKAIQKFLTVSRNTGYLQRPNYSALRKILK